MRLLFVTLDAAFCDDAESLLSLPTLGALADEGVFCDQVRTIYPSLTYPAHTSLITGCYPDRHGIGHNEKYQPQLPASKRPWYWDSGEIRVDTLTTAAARAGREVASLLWPVSGHSRHIRCNFPEVHALPGENQTLKVLSYGSPLWLLRSELRYGRTRPSIRQPHLDRYATLLAEQLILRQYNPDPLPEDRREVQPSARRRRMHMPDLLMLHLVDLDAARHASGTRSGEAEAAKLRLDQNLGRLMHALRRAGALRDTVIAVASDHGQADIQRVLALDSWLKANGLPARAQTLGMGAYIHPERGQYHRVYDALCLHQEELGLEKVYDRRTLRAMHAPEEIELAVEAADGTEIVDDVDEEAHRATHGFGPDHPAARCLLWLSGPPFLKGARLREAELVDIAPTLAYALRLSLPEARGRILREAFI